MRPGRSQPLLFRSTVGNNKYYTATIPPATFQTGDVVQYYLRIAYDDHDTTFVHRNGDVSATTDSRRSRARRRSPSRSRTAAVKGQWGRVFELPNVAIHTHVLPNGRVLMWGRRDNPTDSLDVHECTPVRLESGRRHDRP